jgi:hypothetical protein
MLDLRLSSGSDLAQTHALVDTGSPRTIFPRGIGDLLGVEFPDLDSKARTKITILGRDWPAVTATVTLELLPSKGSTAWEAEVDFVLDDGLPFALLGYEGFFSHWAVFVNGYGAYFVLEELHDYAERPGVIAALRAGGHLPP